MPRYGNWCGPGWSAGQWKDAKDLTKEDLQVPAVDALDMECKIHDTLLHDYPDQADAINKRFQDKASETGLIGKAFGLAVKVGGPSPSMRPYDRSKALFPRGTSFDNLHDGARVDQRP